MWRPNSGVTDSVVVSVQRDVTSNTFISFSFIKKKQRANFFSIGSDVPDSCIVTVHFIH